MALSEEKMREYTKRLSLARMRILINNGFYGLLLMHMVLTIDEECKTVATDGNRIYFGPEFIEELSDSEIDFVMMHEILHVVLQHCQRYGDKDSELFDDACDIVVNSNILLSNNMDLNSITMKKYGESMHLTAGGEEGYKFTAEEVYEMLRISQMSYGGKGEQEGKGQGKGQEKTRGDEQGDGQNKGKNEGKEQGTGQENEESEDQGEGQGEEQGEGKGQGQGKGKGKGQRNSGWDDHSRWTTPEENSILRDTWIKRTIDAVEAIEIQKESASRGTVPFFAKRLLKELKKPQTDWRTVLADFIQEEICDYSFSPPDRRFDDTPFFLPDFNGTEIKVSDILFMVDTSGSMSDKMVTAAYSEIKGAIDQFDGKLQGWLGFFDAAIAEPVPFESEEEFEVIHPTGGGGTDFQIIFEYVRRYMKDNPPVSIIILTDGYAPFPKQSLADGIPVLWLLNNKEVTPPWGKIARIKV